jgi:protein involved in polysaccharide export with SLBB domain
MHSGPARTLILCLSLAAGCASTTAQVETALLADHNPAAHARDLDLHYRVRYPDVLDVHIEGRPDCSGPRPVSIDGRVWLTPQLGIQAGGEPLPGIAHAIARQLRLGETAVQLRVAEYHSQHLYLVGEVGLKHQVVAYRGPETILDLLQRIGGVPPGAEVADVRVVRAHVADGLPPEVFHVDLAAILLHRDLQTNIRLEPFDRIHIGQSRSAEVACQMPPCLRWLGARGLPPR